MCGAGTAARYVSDLRSGAIGCWVGSPQISHVLVATLFIAQIYNIAHLLLKLLLLKLKAYLAKCRHEEAFIDISKLDCAILSYLFIYNIPTI